MKQLSNKIIFVFLLAVGLSLVPAYKADAHWALVEVADGGGGGGGGNNPPSNNISNINLIVQLNKENYNPNEQIRVTATASYAVCSNTAVNIEVYGHIDQESSQIILYKNTVGGDQVNNTQTYTAPNSVGAHIFYGQVEVYKTSNPYISITQDGGDGSFNYDGQPFILNQVFYRYDGGSSFTRVSDGEEFPFSYFSDENGEIHIKIALDVEGDIMRNFSATFVPGVVTTQLLGSTTFSIPFTVVAPTSKSMTIDVYKNGVKVDQGADKVISQAVQSGTELLITYTPSGLSFPFNCDEPVSRDHSNGYTRTFSSQIDITDNNPGFHVIPSKTTNYSVTCYN